MTIRRDNGLHEVEIETWETESPEFVDGRVSWARPAKAQDPRTWLQDTLDFYREARKALLSEAMDHDQGLKEPEGLVFRNSVALGPVAVEAESMLAQNLDALERLRIALERYQHNQTHYDAFEVGRTEAELRAMLKSEPVVQGRKVRAGQAKGAKRRVEASRETRRDGAEAGAREFVRIYKELERSRPKWTQNQRIEYIHEHHSERIKNDYNCGASKTKIWRAVTERKK